MDELNVKQSWRCAVVSVVFLVGLVGCTQAIKQSADFADAGIKYTDAVGVLLDVTADTIIEDDSTTLLYQQKLTVLTDKQQEKKKLKKFLKDYEDALSPLLKTMGRFHHHTRTLGGYFVNLQALAGTDAPERTAMAVEELSKSINDANKTLRESEKLAVSNAEKAALGKLAGLVAKSIQAAKLRKALERDASIIGEQLLLHEKLLGKLSDMLKQSSKEHATILYKNEVRNPYINKTISNEEEWKVVRKQIIKSAFFDQSLDTATRAAQQMRLIWAGILEDKQDLGSIQLLLADITEFTAAARQLKEARQNAGGSNE